MAKELGEIPQVFCKAIANETDISELALDQKRVIYTIARGSSDAAANILSYEFMRELGRPMTSLPPSVFSLGSGVELDDAGLLVISQSGGSDDLVAAAKGGRAKGATVVSLINQPNSPVERHSDVTLPICAGDELAVPATKTVIGSIGAGMGLLAHLSTEYQSKCALAQREFESISNLTHPDTKDLISALLRSRHVFVIGRDTGFGAAHELALKLKECCALHAEAYSASEVLHGPLQLSENALLVILLDTETPEIQSSLDQAEMRFRQQGCQVFRLRPSDVEIHDLPPAAAAALLLYLTYPIALATALALGFDPDQPNTLAKVTKTT